MDSQQMSLSTEQSPKVRVFQDGKEVPAPAAPPIPPILTWLYQSIAAAQLVRLRKLEESKIPTGTTSFDLPVTPTPTALEPSPPWMSFSVINAGPGAVRVEVTSSETHLNLSALIPAGGRKNVDFGFPVITRVMFAAAPGTTATVTVAAIEGMGAIPPVPAPPLPPPPG